MATRIQKVVKLDTVPEEKWPVMVRRTLLGLLFMGFGVAGGLKLAFPWYASAAFFALGGTVMSTQLVVGALKALIEPVRAYKALAGKDGDAAP